MLLSHLNRKTVVVIVALALSLSACSNDGTTVAECKSAVWDPSSHAIPAPTDAGPRVCERGLTELRTIEEDDLTAPSEELRKAYNSWAESAKSLLFECAAETENFDYEELYAEVMRLGEQLDRVLEETADGTT